MNLKPMYKSELAKILRISRKQMMLWINGSTAMDKLVDYGYNPGTRLLTLKQVEIILEELGEIPEGERVQITGYSKTELAQLYGFSNTALLKAINHIPDTRDIKIIMNGNFSRIIYVKKQKNYFKRNEVDLIFKWLGHPFKENAEVSH